MDDDDEPRQRPRFYEWEGWAVCLVGAVMPTVVLTSLVQMIEGKTEPWFLPGLFIGLFTLAVLAIRPWTMR
ncbi:MULTISPECIES: hypothetical protein [unclassified Caulobacter]|jgi:nicotinamide riboside transporter PnuC|uniref:hypothetical protein n=1 Tax=unclassified Caulobacter TaxID=2648921 RepID=UPI000785FFE6|nr:MULTISPECIES: hypothetical protein [unclassified Caulobacter]AZS21710.1 hypothetical protein CSW63_14325 [Caulobacter sp. FWC26]